MRSQLNINNYSSEVYIFNLYTQPDDDLIVSLYTADFLSFKYIVAMDKYRFYC
jgi:hypothetical protein